LTGPPEVDEEDVLDESTVSVVVADDHPMWRDAVARDLTDTGFNVVATADNGLSAVSRTLATRPDVLVLDLNMPGALTSLEAIPRVADASPGTRVVVLTMQDDPQFARHALRAGALGYDVLLGLSRNQLGLGICAGCHSGTTGADACSVADIRPRP